MSPLEAESTWKWGNLRSMAKENRQEALKKAAEKSIVEYAESGSLSDLELVDDDE
jgi:hypothetical protein